MNKIDIKSFSEKINSLNPKEMYAWPFWAQLFVGFIVFILLSAAGVGLHLMGKNDDLTSAQEKEEKLKTEFLEKKKQAINLDLYKAQLEEVTKASDALLKQLPNKSEIEKLLIDINQAGISRGLEFELFKPDREKIYEFYAELPINIKVKGTYDSIGNFAADIGQLSRVVLFTDMSVTTKDDVVTLEATAKTFRYLDPEEVERQRAEKEKEKKKNRPKSEKSESSSSHKAE